VTDWGGLQEIANPDCNFVLGIDGEESALGPIYPITASGGSSIGRLATPSVEHLRTLMRAAYEDRARTRAMGERAAAWIRSEWTYARCAEKWVEAIARLVELEQANGHGRP
jgi:hypothetical protein